jgi:membrane protein implicated in regulation of membrane protease activity
MSGWLAWVIAAAALVGGEVLTMGLFLGPLALAAAAAAVVAGLGAGVVVQFVVFLVGSVASLGLLRPFALRHLRHAPRLRSGTQALIGERALVLDRVDADGGRVKIGGEIWSARCMSEDEVLEPGERAVVLEIKGATALVTK